MRTICCHKRVRRRHRTVYPESAAAARLPRAQVAMCCAGRVFVLVFDHEQTRQPEISLFGSEIMGVRVIPIHAAAVGHSESIVIMRACGDHCARMAVHHPRHVQAVSVNNQVKLPRAVDNTTFDVISTDHVSLHLDGQHYAH